MQTNSRKPAPEQAKSLPELADILPKRIREARGAVSGREFARRLGIFAQSLSRYENPGGNLPGADLLRRMAVEAGVSADWLLGLTDERTPRENAAPVATPEQRAAIEDGARMGVELLPMMRDILRVLAANGANAARMEDMEQRLATLEAHPLASARGGASSRSALDA